MKINCVEIRNNIVYKKLFCKLFLCLYIVSNNSIWVNLFVYGKKKTSFKQPCWVLVIKLFFCVQVDVRISPGTHVSELAGLSHCNNIFAPLIPLPFKKRLRKKIKKIIILINYCFYPNFHKSLTIFHGYLISRLGKYIFAHWNWWAKFLFFRAICLTISIFVIYNCKTK